MKFLLTLFLLSSSFFALDISTRYDVYVTMFGHVGYCDVELHEDKERYEIKVIAKTIDTAAMLLSNRVETFTSKGKIKNGRYIPDVFIKTKETTKKTRHETYTFNHSKKEITLLEKKTKLVNRMEFDSANFKFRLKEVKESSSKEEQLDNYVEDDTLSIYLNSKYGCDLAQKRHKIVAIGANNDKNNISYECLEGAKRNSVIKKFSSELKNIYNLHVEPIDKDSSIVDVLIAYDDDGFLIEGFMDEIFLIGSMRAVRMNHKISNN